MGQLGSEGGAREHPEAHIPVGGDPLFEGHLAHASQGVPLDALGGGDQGHRSVRRGVGQQLPEH